MSVTPGKPSAMQGAISAVHTPSPIVVTFYSYKGGVGRSMALLNVACLLARTGRRVLMIDFDLEAPGLTWLIRGGRTVRPLADVAGTSGVVDLLHQYVHTPEEWAFHPDRGRVELAPYLVPLETPGIAVSPDAAGPLLLMVAGQPDDYNRRLEEVGFRSAAFNRVRKAFALRFREVLRESGMFDYILVDARTGFSDEGYIAARHLGDHVLVFAGLNQQNIEGTAAFVKKTAEWHVSDGRPRSLDLIASPVCEYEDDAKKQRFEHAHARLREVTGVKEIQFALALPYHPRLSLDEALVALEWPDSGLGRAYHQLAEIVRGYALDRFADWSERLTLSLQGRDHQAVERALDQLTIIDARQAASLAMLFGQLARRQQGVDTARQAFGAAVKAYEKVSQLEGVAHARYALAETEQQAGEIEAARRGFEEARGIYRALEHESGVAASLHALGEIDWIQGRYDAARGGLAQALRIFRGLDQQEGVAATLLSLARLDRRLGHYDEARERFKAALDIYRELVHQDGIADSLYHFGDLDQWQGHYAAARRGFEEALQLEQTSGRKIGMARNRRVIARLDRLQGHYEHARRGFEAALQISRALGDAEEISRDVHDIAELDRLHGQYDEARRGFEESLAIDRRLGQRRDALVSEMRLEATLALADGQRSVEALRRATSAAFDEPDPRVRVRAHQLTAEVLASRHDPAQALEHLDQAASDSEKHGLRGLHAETQAQRARCLAELGRDDEARAAAQSAVRFFDEQHVDHPQRSELDALLSKRS